MPDRRLTLHIPLIVWGASYLRTFLSHSLSSQLAPGNLPALSRQCHLLYHIYTTAHDWSALQNSPSLAQLRQWVDLQFHEIVLSSEGVKYHLVNECHQHALKEAGDQPLLFLCPDVIYSDGMFSSILQRLKEGKRAVLMPGVKLSKEALAKAIADHTSRSLAISPRNLVKIALDCFHPFSQCNFWKNREIGHWPAHLYWKAGDQGLLIRGFHIHPFLIWPMRSEKLSDATVDEDFLDALCPDVKRWHVMSDSDEGVAFEFTSEKPEAFPFYKVRRSFLRIGRWVSKMAQPSHRHLATIPILFHHTDIDPAQWKSALEESERVIKKLLWIARLFSRHESWFDWLIPRVKRLTKALRFRRAL